MLCKVHTCTIIDRHARISCFRTGVYIHTFGVSGLFICLIGRSHWKMNEYPCWYFSLLLALFRLFFSLLISFITIKNIWLEY